MKISDNGLDLIKEFEGLRTTAYRDVVGVWTIGYGSTGKHVKPGMKISEERAEELLREDVSRFERCVSEKVKVPLSQPQFDALVSWSFNLGCGALGRSTLLRKLNRGEYDSVPREMKRWNRAGGRVLAGLTRRRQAEAVMFMV